MQEQYGVAYDPTSDEIAVLMTDSACTQMAPDLRMLLPLDTSLTTRTFTLPVNGTQRGFTVGEVFYKDAIERGNIVFSSVRGAGLDGQPVHYTELGQLQRGSGAYVLGESLNAFVQAEGPAAETLTHLLNQKKIGAAVVEGLKRMDMDSPFKLNDGTVVRLEREGVLGLDMAQTEDGDFRIATTVRFTPILCSKGTRPDGTDVFLIMSLDTLSWAEVQFTLMVPPDVQRIEVVELPQVPALF